MLRLLCRRIAGMIGLLSLAGLIVTLDPLLRTAPFAGVWSGPAFTVNRGLKGDRLPSSVSPATYAPATPVSPLPATRPRAQMPIGCDPAFSPIFSAALGNVYGRCMT